MKNCPKCGAEESAIQYLFKCGSTKSAQSFDCLTAELAIVKEKLNVAGGLLETLNAVTGTSLQLHIAMENFSFVSKVQLAMDAAKQFLDENPELKGGK